VTEKGVMKEKEREEEEEAPEDELEEELESSLALAEEEEGGPSLGFILGQSQPRLHTRSVPA